MEEIKLIYILYDTLFGGVQLYRVYQTIFKMAKSFYKGKYNKFVRKTL
jgi:hypothetical protein